MITLYINTIKKKYEVAPVQLHFQKIPVLSTNVWIYDRHMARILLKEVMEKKRITPDHILPFVSCSRATLYRILNGEKRVRLDELEEFAKVLNVAIEDLYESEYSRKNKSQF